MFFFHTLRHKTSFARKALLMASVFSVLASCAQVNTPGARNVNIPSPTMANERPEAVNEKPDSVLYLPLGSDVLVPEAESGDALPDEIVGPFELRSETLAGALQLILADYELPMAFETDEALTRTITVANLRGPLSKVVKKVCGLADLYCSYEDGLLVVKETQTFTVTVPPVGGETDILSALATGLQAITGSSATTEAGTRTIIYEATNRTADLANRYFQKIRSNTALIVFEVYIWEVSLNSDNSTGINWDEISSIGNVNVPLSLPQVTVESAISIGLPTTGDAVDGNDVLQFISNYGAVKTISQPQITVLSGAQATLRAADTVNYVSSLSRSVDDGEVTVSTETDSVDTGFTMTISSAWDNATVYGTIEIALQEFQGFDDFEADGTVLQLPRATERELTTQIRIRPGDSLLIAGLVRESDTFDKSGPGFKEPIFPTSRSAGANNTELVFLLRPRVIVYTADEDSQRLAPGTDSITKQSMDPSADPNPLPARKEEELDASERETIPTDLLNPGG